MTFSVPFDDRLSSAAAAIMFPDVKKKVIRFSVRLFYPHQKFLHQWLLKEYFRF
jgi:hypothetical protein